MDLPLSGYRVVEMGTMVAAPFASHILSQLGAEVIKVEPPRGDTTRSLIRGGPSGTIIAYSHGKKGLSIDLTQERGRQTFQDLIKTADVFVHNLAPNATVKPGIDDRTLRQAKPDLVYCHIRGYAAGPQENDLATNPVAEAATGVMDDHRVNGRPTRLGPSYHDQFAGTYAVIRILAALLDPSIAESRHIDIGLYETGLHLASRDLAGLQLKTQLLGKPEKEAGGEFAMPGYGAYQTADGHWLYLLVITDAHWQRLTQALELEEGQDPELATLRGRKKQRQRVEDAVAQGLRKHTRTAAIQRLSDNDVGFTEVMSLEHVLDTPQAQHPGKLRTVAYRGLEFSVPEFPGGATVTGTSRPPELGEHAEEILTALGYDKQAQQELLRLGAVKIAQDDEFVWVKVPRKAAAL